jgi:hypothetical protein
LSRIFGKRPGYNFKGLGKFADAILVQAKRCVSDGCNGACQLYLNSACASAQAVIFGEHLENRDSGVD